MLKEFKLKDGSTIKLEEGGNMVISLTPALVEKLGHTFLEWAMEQPEVIGGLSDDDKKALQLAGF